MSGFYSVFPCLGFLGFCVLLFGFILAMRYLNYRETMTLAEKGLVKPVKRNGGNGSLIWGIVITSLGLALSAGLYPIGFMTGMNLPLGLGPWMILGFFPTFFGLGLILIYVLTRKGDEKKVEEEKEEKKSDS